MLIKYQALVLKKLLSFFYFTVNIFGLWAFKFTPSNRHIKYSCVKAFYSAFLLCFGSATYWIIGSYFLSMMKRTFVNTFTLKLVLSIHSFSVLITFLFVHIGLHINSRKIEIAYSKCKKLIDVLNGSFCHKHICIWSYLLDIILKTVVFDTVIVLLHLQSYSKFPIKMSSIVSIFLLLPKIAVRLHLNVFYGALLVFNVYFKKLNASLSDIVVEAKFVRSQNQCDLSDRLDAISIIYIFPFDRRSEINKFNFFFY